jgi:VCBS repeat-containing protein
VQSSSVGSVSSVVNGSYGSITIDANGSYIYTIDDTNAAVQALRLNGQTLDDVFTYTATDAGGLTSTTQLTVTIRGRNDNPVGVNDTNTAVEAGGVTNGTAGTNPTGNVLTNDTDVDSNANGETKTVNAVGAGSLANTSGYESNVASTVTGSYGSITIAADGSYTYTVDNSNSAVQASDYHRKRLTTSLPTR